MKQKFSLTATAAMTVIISALFIQAPHAAETADNASAHAHTMQAMAMPATATPQDVYAPAMEKMHHDMMVTPTGDPDIDFVNGMIPHHQGAIDMAKIELEHGKDPEIRKLAEGIVAAQEKEIAFMKEWQAKHIKQNVSTEKK